MSMAIAGALKGLGAGLVEQALQMRKEAWAEVERQRDLEDYWTKLEMKEGFKRGGGGSGGRSRRGSGGGGIGAAVGAGDNSRGSNWQPRSMDYTNIRAAFESIYDGDLDAPPYHEFVPRSVELMRGDKSIDPYSAANAVASQWTERSHVEQVPRSSLGKWWHGTETKPGGTVTEHKWRQPVSPETSGQPGLKTAVEPNAGQAMSILEQARKAIAAGASRDKVIQRLIDNGIDPAGL